MQTSTYQANRQQILLMGSTIFVSITAAVVVSTLLVMSLMRGEIASALNSNVQNSSPVAQVGSTCSEPQTDYNHAASVDNHKANTYGYENHHSADMPTHYATKMSHHMMPHMTKEMHYIKPSAPVTTNNSYNTTNTNTINTTNNVNNTDNHKTTIITDSFNKDSYNDNSHNSHNPVVVKDNVVNLNSHNTKNVDSHNTSNVNKTHNTTVGTVNHDSNNTVNSNNKVEAHLLSDNIVTVPVVPIVPAVPVPSV